MRPTFLIAALLTAAGCGAAAVPGPEGDIRNLPPETISLRVGESRLVGPVSVFFARVVGESRCPEDVVCVWHGNAEVELHLSIGKRPSHPVTLNTHLDPRSVEWTQIRIALIDLKPHPRTDIRVDPTAYTVDLRVGGIAAP
jgi:hypothetical protein